MSSSLAGCVESLRSSMQLLDSTIHILDDGVNDLPRLEKVLQTTRHFELISEPALRTAQSSLINEIGPEVESLLARVENYLSKLERREQALIAKCDLNEGRLGNDNSSGNNSGSAFRSKSPYAADSRKSLNPAQELKAKALRAKKERLSYAVGTLEMQARQRERQLRMSMAAPQRIYEDD